MFYDIKKPLAPKEQLKLCLKNRYDYEHIGRLPESDYKWRKQIYLKKLSEAELQLNEAEKMEKLKEIHYQEFHKRTSKKGQNQEIQKLVNIAMNSKQQELDNKRQRLKIRLQEENDLYESEIQLRNATRIESNIQERENRLLNAKLERENQRQTFVEQKKLEQIFTNCDEIRLDLRKRLTKDCKTNQMLQMEYNKLLKKIAKDEEFLWDEISKRVHDEMIKRENEESQLAQFRNTYDLKILKQQVDEREYQKQLTKDAVNRENLEISVKIKENKDYDVKMKMKEFEKKQQYALQLNKQREEIENIRRQSNENDAQMDKLFLEAITNEIQKENEKCSQGNEAQKRETLQYLNYLRGIKREHKLNELEMDKLLGKFLHEIDNKTVLSMKDAKAKRKALNLETSKILLKQIEQQHEQHLRDEAQRIRSADEAKTISESQIQLDRENEIEKRHLSMEYGKELLAQIEYETNQKEHQKKIDQIVTRNFHKENEFRIQLAKKFIDQNFDTLPIHPNAKKIFNN